MTYLAAVSGEYSADAFFGLDGLGGWGSFKSIMGDILFVAVFAWLYFDADRIAGMFLWGLVDILFREADW